VRVVCCACCVLWFECFGLICVHVSTPFVMLLCFGLTFVCCARVLSVRFVSGCVCVVCVLHILASPVCVLCVCVVRVCVVCVCVVCVVCVCVVCVLHVSYVCLVFALHVAA